MDTQKDRIIQLEVNRINGRTAYHTNASHPVIQIIMEDVSGMTPPSEIIEPSAEYEIWADNIMRDALDIPDNQTREQALVLLSKAITTETPTRVEYYDDQVKKGKIAVLPYNREQAIQAAGMLLASGENDWLDQTFQHVDPYSPEKTEQVTGREILSRISADLEYPEHLGFAYSVACAIPAKDPYWEAHPSAIPGNNKVPMFPKGGPSKPNVIDSGNFCVHTGINPENALEQILLFGALHKKSRELQPENPDPLLILRKACEVYDPQKMLRDLEIKCPGGKELLTKYAVTLNLPKICEAVLAKKEEDPGYPKRFFDDMLIAQCLFTDPREQPKNAVGRVLLKDLQEKSFGRKIPEPEQRV
jgi:hypothetical protein